MSGQVLFGGELGGGSAELFDVGGRGNGSDVRESKPTLA